MFRRQPFASKLLLNKPRKSTSYRLQGTDTRPCRHVYLASTLPGFILGLAGMLALGQIILEQSASAVDYTMSITTSGSRSINVAPRADGVGTSISADNINVQTTCRAGYNLTVSTSVNDNNLYLDGDVANNTSGTYFTPATGSSTLKNSPNTWGYLVSDSTPSENSTFSAVPVLGSPATIKTPVSSTSDIDDHFNVYYGVSVANGMNTGTYKMIPDTSVTPNKDGVIMYYLTMADACTSYTVQYNATGTNLGTAITGTGTVADQTIHEGVTTALTTDTFTGPTIDGTTYYFAGWNTAQDGSGTSYASGETVTDLAAVGQTITLYAQWTDCPGGKVCYDPVATGVTDTMADQSVSNTATTINLWASNFQRSGYGFAGWNTKADGSGTSYGPNETLTITAGQYSTAGLHLYAMWVEPAKDGSNNPLAMQNWTGCSSMSTGDITALTDSRDNNTYAIAKLADGNCWMIENLRLDNTAELTTTNTNSPLATDGTVTLLNTDGTTTNHLSASTNPTTTAWCTTNSSACDDQSMLYTGNTADATANMTGTSVNIYSYGNYYNWYSATAGNGTYSKSSGNTSGDLCPTGWHLPTGKDASGDFGVLDIALGGTGASSSSSTTPTGAAISVAWRKWPNNFVYSGNFNGSSVSSRGSNGNYWSSTARSSSNAYNLSFGSSYVYPGTYNVSKYSGRTVRCVAPAS